MFLSESDKNINVSLPIVRKSRCTNSSGYVQIIGLISSHSWGCLNFVQHSQVQMCFLMSSDILGQKNLSSNNPRVFSIPR